MNSRPSTDALERAHDRGWKDAPARLKGKPASATSLHVLNDATATMVATTAKEVLAAVTVELDAHLALIEDLQNQVTKFEQSTIKSLADAHKGPWTAGVEYQRGELVTYSGSVWLCMQSGCVRPGGEKAEWRLVVKAGRDVRR